MENIRQLLSVKTPNQAKEIGISDNCFVRATTGFSLSPSRSTQSANIPPTEAATYGQLRLDIHKRLLASLDMHAVLRLQDEDAVAQAVEKAIELLVEEEATPLSASEKRALTQDVLNEVLGIGPLEPLLSDPSLSDILVNGHETVWVDRYGRLERTDVKFQDEEHLLHVINRIVARIGRRIDESSPIVDARLPDGSRVNAVIRPLSLDGPCLSIRRFRHTPFLLQDLINGQTLSAQMAKFLSLAVISKLNILVSGGTAAGKTTLLNVLSGYISDLERIITVEDTSELQLQQSHVLRMESRPPNTEGKGAVNQRELIRNSLRMRPDRIIVGEVRGPEALDMLQAMNTGHDGSLTTLHANSPRDALSRLETLVLLSGVDLSQRSIREQIASAFDLIVQIKRLPDGSRKIVSVVEVTGMEAEIISLQELYTFKQTGISPEGKIIGSHCACGIRPQAYDKFQDFDIEIDESLHTDIYTGKEFGQ
jgi:pilus assembly protein CpaF